MEGVTHRFVHTNGIRIHFVEKGLGPTALLLHGFPECWYSWRHQINALADAGYHVVAPDMRGYGQSDAPKDISSYASLHVVGDLICLLDHLNQNKVFVIGHDWGAVIAWDLCLFRPDRVHALVAFSVYSMRNSSGSRLSYVRKALGENFYMCRFQEPGKAEADFASRNIKSIFKAILVNTESVEMFATVPEPETLPPWLTEEDIKFYSDQYEKTGFTGPLNYYRAIDITWELKAPWTGKTIDVPTLLIIGDRDGAYNFPGASAKEYIHSVDFAKAVSNLQDIVVIEDAGHFVHEEKAAVVNDLLVKFLKKFV